MLVEFFNIMASSNQIGKRIDCMGEIGTVKYVGTVQGHPATWLGIDWDSPERGKHNGTVNNVVYFEATFAKSGSFVRPEKVHFGQSVLEAITSRYGQHEDEVSAKFKEQQILSFQKTINAPFLQMVGFDKVIDKQSNFEVLEVINIRMQKVNSTDLKGLHSTCPNIRELDISKNLLNSWLAIFDICSQLSQLTWLNVSENILTIPENCAPYRFPNITTLICGTMRLEWAHVLALSKIFPNVEELRVPSNLITCLDSPEANAFKNLQLLDLENNHIQHWSEINKLGQLPSLDHLILENTCLQRIAFANTSNKIQEFKNLKKIMLKTNNIDNWESIAELNKLENLEDLKIMKNPIFEADNNYNTCVQLIIARIANLKTLNGSEIAPGERKGAEYDYLKKFGMEWLSVKNTENQEEFLRRHNRFLELIENYGTPEESEMKVESKIIKVSLVDVSIVHNEETITKKLPPSLMIQKLILMVQRLFKLADRPNLVYISGDIEIELNDECKELGFYSMQSGDKIVVNP